MGYICMLLFFTVFCLVNIFVFILTKEEQSLVYYNVWGDSLDSEESTPYLIAIVKANVLDEPKEVLFNFLSSRGISVKEASSFSTSQVSYLSTEHSKFFCFRR